ncbi:MAG: hypothetical protein HYY96_12020 [Candidatus Tectomicrobia bacterium]|nr:hypothetical protein [Candidatus Tectomicrobia bacterium]
MAGHWKEVVRLRFKGSRFRDHALDIGAITELSRFQKMIAETAKTLWRESHPERERLPKHFEERTSLCLRRIAEGSAVAPLEVYIGGPTQEELFEQDTAETEVEEAIELAHKVFHAAQIDEPLPPIFPKTLIPEYENFGQGLEDDEEIEMMIDEKEPAHVTPTSRSRLAALVDVPHENQVDVTGEVLEADVRQGRFQVWLDEKTGISAVFSPEQEDHVTGALRDHNTLRLQIIGEGEFSPQGKLLRITKTERLLLKTLADAEDAYDTTVKPIEDVLTELAREVPQEDWDKLPPDLTDNLDHYLYGTPKR